MDFTPKENQPLPLPLHSTTMCLTQKYFSGFISDPPHSFTYIALHSIIKQMTNIVRWLKFKQKHIWDNPYIQPQHRLYCKAYMGFTPNRNQQQNSQKENKQRETIGTNNDLQP